MDILQFFTVEGDSWLHRLVFNQLSRYCHLLNGEHTNNSLNSQDSRSNVGNGSHMLNVWRHNLRYASLPTSNCPPFSADGGRAFPSTPSFLNPFERMTHNVHIAKTMVRRDSEFGRGLCMPHMHPTDDYGAHSSNYHAGFEEAINHLQHLIYKGRGPRGGTS
ncbi:hypothetical protein KC19_VG179800 [Ceratodon purpureus]|uniref:Uncharacterized protein n=1 Tax=Ceratodon purpureus TaxID=3225 RepID=A0A8T0HRV1_CERPU|nr:hypothetical protein KC19_VG179800 [Ceratodon purpureus]